MNRRNFLKNSAGCAALLGISPWLTGCKPEYYRPENFAEAPHTDVHFHYNSANDAVLRFAAENRMHLVSVNVDTGLDIDFQLNTVIGLRKTHPDALDFLGTFTTENFGHSDYADRTIARIEHCLNAGARGVKIWKNIGMTLRDAAGNYVMCDHPAFQPVFAWMEKNDVPLMAHLGEPRNCWLPYEEMSMKNDLRYYQNHPEYHMNQHPEMPSYEAQISARDNVLRAHPRLTFVGAHIGSMEWSISEVATRLREFPRFMIDLSARMSYLHLQAHQDRAALNSFLNEFQDRILYGSDVTLGNIPPEKLPERNQSLKHNWFHHWLFIATDANIITDNFTDATAPKEMQGMQMPRPVVDKIFHGNTKRIFGCGQ